MDPYDHTPVLTDYYSYETARREFEWERPAEYNVASDVVETQPAADARTALLVETENGSNEFTYDDLDRESGRLANLLADLGVERGDRVAVVLPNGPSTLLTHLAVFRLGAVLVPLPPTAELDALAYRLRDSEAAYLVGTAASLDTVASAVDLDGQFAAILSADPDERADRRVDRDRDRFDADFETRGTSLDDPAMLVYTSGTTGDPKGVLHGQGHFVGCYPGVEMWNDLEVGPERVVWANAEWAYVGGLAYLYGALHYGATVVCPAIDDRSNPVAIVDVLRNHDVTNAFVKPGHLERVRSTIERPPDLPQLSVVSTGGTPYDQALLEWVESALGATPVEAYGQTEAQLFLSDCPAWFEAGADQIGKPVPGADVSILDPNGTEVESGEIGELSLRTDHPVAFLRYENAPEATAAARSDGRMVTDVMCRRDGADYVEFVARTDDVIAVGGRYVAPADVERAIASHTAVARAGVVSPNGGTGDDVVAYVELSDSATERSEDGITDDLRTHVAERLDPHERPDAFEVIADVPTTKRGKVRRTELRDRKR